MVGWKPCAYTTITWLPPGKVAFSLKTPVQGKPTVILHHQPRKSSPINLYNCSNQSTSFDNSETNKVYRFGAWLDEHIAGDALLQCERNCHIPTDSTVTRQQQAYSFFCCGVKEFDVGCYDAAANWFHKATVYGDPSSRTGGQYQLWTAQALHAAGKRDTAKNALQKLKYHKDRDVLHS
ncbi:hypothetical protein Gasu2_12160 [Galdieria sulphuraria]|nr:hypothetical protein Gasu2_12160 [Galdieria sulphuraria]